MSNLKLSEIAKQSINDNINPCFESHSLWLRNGPIVISDDPHAPLCGIPLEQVDIVIRNAKKYTNIKFSIWYDSKDDPLRF